MGRGNEKYAVNKRSDRYTQSTDTDKSFTVTANFHKEFLTTILRRIDHKLIVVNEQGYVEGEH